MKIWNICLFLISFKSTKHDTNQNQCNMAYEHKNSKGQTYYLHTQEVRLKSSNKQQTIYFFAKDKRSNACNIPAGKTVVENQRTGLPFLKKA